MRRKITFSMSGPNVVQKTEVFDAEGVLQRETEIVLGDKDTVLAQVTKQAAEAKAEVDGVTAAAARAPIPDTGNQGESLAYFEKDGYIYRTEIRRGADGKMSSARTAVMGRRSACLANCVARSAELAAVRDGVAAAK
jgi:hypothetical protein